MYNLISNDFIYMPLYCHTCIIDGYLYFLRYATCKNVNCRVSIYILKLGSYNFMMSYYPLHRNPLYFVSREVSGNHFINKQWREQERWDCWLIQCKYSVERSLKRRCLVTLSVGSRNVGCTISCSSLSRLCLHTLPPWPILICAAT